MRTPSHDELAGCLRCLIYDLNVLATSTERMMTESDDRLVEAHKTSALVKLRTVFDFFHRPAASDSIKLQMFQVYNPNVPPPHSQNWDTWLTHQSINTYVVHLDVERVTKTVPQPKFSRGERAVLRTAVALVNDAKDFIDSVSGHQEFVGLNSFRTRWRAEFVDTLNRLNSMVAANTTT
jgi:hypothetical protein